MTDLGGKTVLVTGASRGIGAAIARACAVAGADVVLHYSSNRDAIETVAAEIGSKCAGIVQGDFADSAAPAAVWQEALDVAPRLDGLVNNAAMFIEAPLDLADDPWLTSWDQTLRVNLAAPALLSKCALAHFREHGAGTILNIASRAGQRGDDLELAAYAASKGGLLALTKTLARGLGPDNIKVFAIAPGWVETDMAPTAPEAIKQALSEIPLRRMADADEVGSLAAFLLSEACPSATGATFDINGASYVR